MKKSNYDKRLFGLAESLIRDIERADKPVQPEDLMLWIQAHVPRTETEDKEFEEELREMMPDRSSPGRSSIKELRQALGFTDEMSLLSVIRTAAEVCQRAIATEGLYREHRERVKKGVKEEWSAWQFAKAVDAFVATSTEV